MRTGTGRGIIGTTTCTTVLVVVPYSQKEALSLPDRDKKEKLVSAVANVMKSGKSPLLKSWQRKDILYIYSIYAKINNVLSPELGSMVSLYY